MQAIKSQTKNLLLIITALIPVISLGQKISTAKTPDNPKWWKGNLHTHSLWSDGNHYPEMIATWYKDQGYNFLTFTDHNIFSKGQKWLELSDHQAFQKYLDRYGKKWVQQKKELDKTMVRIKPLDEFRCLVEEQQRFLLIQGEEITGGVHVNGINLLEVIKPQDGNTVTEVIQNDVNAILQQQKTTGQSMLAILNHPNDGWYITAEDMMHAKDLKFFEVYNGILTTIYNIGNYGDEKHAGTERMWDIILTKRLAELEMDLVYGLGTDDAHHYHDYGAQHAPPGQAWIMVRAYHLTPESIIAAMHAGDFYATTGVTLNDITSDNQKFEIKIKPEKNVTYTTYFIGTQKGYDPAGKPVLDDEGKESSATRIYSKDIGTVLDEVQGTNATYSFKGDEIYLRAKVVSSKPKKIPTIDGERETAWVQPIIPKNIP